MNTEEKSTALYQPLTVAEIQTVTNLLVVAAAGAELLEEPWPVDEDDRSSVAYSALWEAMALLSGAIISLWEE